MFEHASLKFDCVLYSNLSNLTSRVSDRIGLLILSDSVQSIASSVAVYSRVKYKISEKVHKVPAPGTDGSYIINIYDINIQYWLLWSPTMY